MSVDKSSRRLLLALLPDPGTQETIFAYGKTWLKPKHNTTVPHRMHLSLHGFNWMHPDIRQRLIQALHEVPVEPMLLSLRRTGKLSDLYAVLHPDPLDRLHTLHRALAIVLRRTGLETDWSFNPHVTLSRTATDARSPRKEPNIPWCVCDFALVISTPYPQPYKVLMRYGVTAGSESIARLAGSHCQPPKATPSSGQLELLAR
jgi:2'-5' RNA ligase